MQRLYSFEWQPKALNGAGDWHSKAKVYQTTVRAEGAALRWAADMRAEDCEVATRVVELVDDGRGGRVPKVLFTVR